MRPLIIDLRCLQDRHHAERGIANHARSLLAHAPGHIIGLVDPNLPDLPPGIAARAAELRPHGYVPAESAMFLNPSPMTANQAANARLLLDPRVTKAAVVYDFIPHDEPARYLTRDDLRLDYRCSLAWLRHYDLFFPISAPTETQLRALYGAVESHVTGVALPDWTAGIAASSPRHILMIGGDDERKNAELLGHAHAASAILRGVKLVVTGRTTSLQRAALSGAALPGRVSPTELRALYAAAVCVVVPSRAEGFSMPVIEAAAAGAPVLASDIPAHRALLPDPAHRFGVDDTGRLTALLERLVTAPAARRQMIEAQAPLAVQFTATAVAARVFGPLSRPAAPAILRRARPHLAMLTPLPPTASGVADYSAATIAALRAHIDVTAITASTGTLDAHINPRFDRVLSVIGNSAGHGLIADLAISRGSAVLCHDQRLMGLATRHGLSQAANIASAELGQPVSVHDILAWSADEDRRRASFLGPLACAARPLIFHARQPAALCQARFGADARHLPFAIYRPFTTPITPGMRAAARARLGFAPDKKYIASFGIVHSNKAIGTALDAFARLRESLDAHLIFAGPFGEAAAEEIAARGLGHHVTTTSVALDEAAYRDHLLAADVALQLRRGGPGNISGALQDAIAAGLPAVANSDLADNLAAPDYVTRIPDDLPPDDIAHALLAQLTAPPDTQAARQAYARDHSMAHYAEGLLRLLDLI